MAAEPNAPAYEENDLIFRAPNGELLGTGAKRPNADQWAWGEQHLLKASHVKLNALDLAFEITRQVQRDFPEALRII